MNPNTFEPEGLKELNNQLFLAERGRPFARRLIYARLDAERDYQDFRWNPETTTSGGKHEIGAWILFMEDYLAEARSQISRGADPQASDMALHSLRKVAAMAIACFEQYGGCPDRGDY